jgi:hypothetical protein
MTAEEAESVDQNYATWASLNLPGNSITVGEKTFSKFSNYFATYGFDALEENEYDEIVSKLAELVGYEHGIPINQTGTGGGMFSIPSQNLENDGKPENPLLEHQQQFWDSLSKDEKQRLKEIIGWGWKFEFYNMSTAYDIDLTKKVIYIDYRYWYGFKKSDDSLISVMKEALHDERLPLMKYNLNDVLTAYKAIFGNNEPLLKTYLSSLSERPDNILEVVPILKNTLSIGGSSQDRILGYANKDGYEYYVIRISDQCRTPLEAAILLYNELIKATSSRPMQSRILASGNVDLYNGIPEQIFNEQFKPFLKNVALAIEMGISLTSDCIDTAISISEFIETKDVRYLASASLPFVTAGTVKAVGNAANAVAGTIKEGDNLGGVGKVVFRNRGGSIRSQLDFCKIHN